MKKIVCELCECTEFTKADGVFTCNNCGTSYSLEEAKAMMKEVEGATPAVGVGAPAVNPNQQQLENILMLATNAYSASNNEETEKYCNRAIELDASCYKAWILKGKAIGWSSKLDDNRLEEAAHSFMQAITFAPEDEKEAVKEEVCEELKRLGLACVNVRKNRFSKYPDDEELNGFITDLKPLVTALSMISQKGASGLLTELTSLLDRGTVKMRFTSMKIKGTSAGIPEDFFDEVALMMNEAGVAGFETVRERYDGESTPDRNDFQKALTEADNCIELIECAIAASDDDDEEDIIRYNNIKIIYEYTIDMAAYANYSDYSKNWMLTPEAKDTRRKLIKECDEKIAEIKEKAKKAEEEAAKAEEAAKQERIAAYWEAHKEEKAKLDNEKKALEDKISSLEEQLTEIGSEISEIEKEGNANTPSEEEVVELKKQISKLESEKSSLGIFAGKEKKRIAEEVSVLQGKVSEVETKAKAERATADEETKQKIAPLSAKQEEINDEITAANNRIEAIDDELNKDPE